MPRWYAYAIDANTADVLCRSFNIIPSYSGARGPFDESRSFHRRANAYTHAICIFTKVAHTRMRGGYRHACRLATISRLAPPVSQDATRFHSIQYRSRAGLSSSDIRTRSADVPRSAQTDFICPFNYLRRVSVIVRSWFFYCSFSIIIKLSSRWGYSAS